jgi:hypothetical protein
MSRLGSEKRPVVVRVHSEERGREVAELCHSHGLHYLIELGSDLPDDLSDLERALHPPQPLEATPRLPDGQTPAR